MNAQHSAKTDQHGTPPSFLKLARATIGSFDVDPASSAMWNENVRARRFITKQQNGLRTPWFPGAPAPLELRTQARCPNRDGDEPGTVFLNPPGDRRGALVAAFWWALAEYFAWGWATSAVYIGFSVEQLARLQRVGARSHPLLHVTLVPAWRENYVDAETGELQEDATHASFVTLLSRSGAEIETFAGLGSELGFVINGDRR
jgi:hypothetical protein